MTPATARDPDLSSLLSAALADGSACGPLSDWLEEHGMPEAAAFARLGFLSHARFLTCPRDRRSPLGRRLLVIGGWLVGLGIDLAAYRLRIFTPIEGLTPAHAREFAFDPIGPQVWKGTVSLYRREDVPG
jgi:hypothetical protein